MQDDLSSPHACCAGADTGTVTLWDLRKPDEPIDAFGKGEAAVTRVARLPSAGGLVTGYDDGTCTVWNTADGSQVELSGLDIEAVTDLAVLQGAEHNTVVTTGHDGRVRFYAM